MSLAAHIDLAHAPRRSRWLGACLALLLAVTAATAAEARETRTEEIEKTFRLQPGGEVILQNVNGQITVEGWDRDRVELKIVKQAKAGSAESAERALRELEVKIESTPERLHVEVERPDGWNGITSWLRHGNVQSQASFTLKVPRHVILDARTVNGQVDLTQLNGEVEASTTNGHVGLSQVAGKVRARTTNGSVSVEEARGSVSAHTTNGRIRVAMLAVTPNADMEFSTTNGSVNLELPDGVQTRLSARTSNGSIRSDFDLPVEKRGNGRAVEADLNGGGDSNLRVRTTNGGISIQRL